ncbi:sugar phosphate isomerase/epimerase family protein [Runella slithyformis]|uniref:Xylose isomerase domain-containing protein TIM barrel n=1 Tax=Runella slithyformis (strain ATCC 29530 / DSM 19594 / LMG 11500 / NCIMB 11436 / LSU 4) TaxID=761193 RepID=A0A7U3ZM01_RUNSL|nr:TIM barrel protein [Runella slithyformis]AEI49685.1 Xylose isomerase domain-containing protein TIM barrel [Runella slithyformis DSM 19594]
MKIKILIFSVWGCCFFTGAPAQKIKNDFFALHNIIRGDSAYDTFDKQVELIKNAGFDGIEINQTQSFDGMKAALDKHRFTGAYFYVRVELKEPYIDKRLEEYIRQLRGSKTIIAPFIIADAARFKPSTHGADTLAVRLLTQISDWAKASGLEVALYPHYGFYVERTDHALALIRQINRKNVGLTFNLCHWLATTSAAERTQLKPHLKELQPYLKMMTVCGANDVITQQKTIWDDYILPLGTGSFDTYGLIRYAVKALKFNGPIGVQCYNIKGNKPQLVQTTIKVWRGYTSRLEREQ